MKVLYCVSEVAPIVKVGGLGDVAGSLPKALARLGVDIRIVVPKYKEIDTKILRYYDAKKVGELGVEFAGKQEGVVVWQTVLPNSQILVYLLENDTYLSKNGHQAFAGTEKETERFAFFSKAIATWLNLLGSTRINTNMAATDMARQKRLSGRQHESTQIDWFPDLLHLNDWHTSLVPLFLSSNLSALPAGRYLPSLLTIHNLSYQGIAPLDLLEKLGLKTDFCKVLWLDPYLL